MKKTCQHLVPVHYTIESSVPACRASSRTLHGHRNLPRNKDLLRHFEVRTGPRPAGTKLFIETEIRRAGPSARQQQSQ